MVSHRAQGDGGAVRLSSVEGTISLPAAGAVEPTRPVRVSVVVPARDAADSLPTLLARLAAQSLPAEDLEVIVVDDCSSDDTACVVERSGLARLVRADRRSGSFRARNLGVAVARGAYLAFTDADCLPAPDWLECALAAFADPGLDLAAGAIHIPLGRRPSTAALIDSARCLDQERYVREGFGATANLVVRREVFERVGGFNDIIISGGDTEFGHRAIAAGASLRYVTEAVIEHEPRASAAELARKAFRLGYGAAQQRFHADGPLRDRPLYWTHPGSWLPRGGVAGMHRIEGHGYRVSRARRVRMHVLHYVCFRLPSTLGNVAGTAAEVRRARRG